GRDQARVVEDRAEGVRERVAELAAFVDRARRLRRGMARHAAGEGELPEELAQSRLVLRDVRIDLAVGALEVGVREAGRTAVSGPGHEDHVEVVAADDA